MTDKCRFIAGAVCPECGAEDRIVVETGEAGPRQRCVACGFSLEQTSESDFSNDLLVVREIRPDVDGHG
jgi:uncharacterized metal-binding protein (TIGR02443 family)